MTSPLRPSSTAIQALGIIASLGVLGCIAGPAIANDTGFWETFRAPSQFRPQAAPRGFAVMIPPPTRIAPAKPQVVRLPAAPVVTPTVPPDPSKRENPLAGILRDPTLRHGDVVMFPDGPRVFKGAPGGRHGLNDFVSVAASRDLPPSSRKTLLALPVGENKAWSSTVVAARDSGKDKGAAWARDVDTTGSIGPSRGGKTVTVYSGTDVRVVRVPN